MKARQTGESEAPAIGGKAEVHDGWQEGAASALLDSLHEESGLEEAEQLAVQPVGRFGRNPVAHAFEALVAKRTGHMLS